MKKFLLALILVLLGGGYLLGNFAVKQTKRASSLEAEQKSLYSEIEYYKTENEKTAAKVVELTVTKDEFEKMFDYQNQVIQNLRLQIRNLESISTTIAETNINATADLKDTVILVQIDTLYTEQPAKYFEWEDSWNRIEGLIKDDTVECNYHGQDTLNVVITRVPKKFLFFNIGTKYMEADISNENPSSSIVYNKTIKISKRRRR